MQVYIWKRRGGQICTLRPAVSAPCVLCMHCAKTQWMRGRLQGDTVYHSARFILPYDPDSTTARVRWESTAWLRHWSRSELVESCLPSAIASCGIEPGGIASGNAPTLLNR